VSTSPVIRRDLAEAHAASLIHAVSDGPALSAEQRHRIADVVRAATLDPSPPPPWAQPFGDPLLDVAHRITRHAGTITESWYRQVIAAGMDALTWVEILGVVASVVPPITFARGVGAPVPELPPPLPGLRSGRLAAQIVDARLNWVPVAAPADAVASVVQALSALPDEWANLWQLAEAQYMGDRQMDDPQWNRGTLSRPQMELVAARLSLLRECFF
jgi:hypothetical protein